jgi:hypothetical protein
MVKLKRKINLTKRLKKTIKRIRTKLKEITYNKLRLEDAIAKFYRMDNNKKLKSKE